MQSISCNNYHDDDYDVSHPTIQHRHNHEKTKPKPLMMLEQELLLGTVQSD